MKKLILSLFVFIIGFIGFSNAGTVNCSTSITKDGGGNFEWNYNGCVPGYISSSVFGDNDEIEISALSNLDSVCHFGEGELPEGVSVSDEMCDLSIGLYNCNLSNGDDCVSIDTMILDDWTPDYFITISKDNFPNGVYFYITSVYFSKSYFDASGEIHEITEIPVSVNVSYEGGDNPSEGGNGGNIVPDGSLVAVITGVFSVFGELIPYVVYIGIGILIVTVGFYAIRWLVNWLSDKINNNFKF